MPHETGRTISFVSTCSLIDTTSGAAIAALKAFHYLTTHGFTCRAFCSSWVDEPESTSVRRSLDEQNAVFETRAVATQRHSGRLIIIRQGTIPISMFEMGSQNQWQGPAELGALIQAYREFLQSEPPGMILAYGGDPVTDAMIEIARRQGIPVVLWLHNFGYDDVRFFRHVDYAITPSHFAREWYFEKLGLICQTIPNVLPWDAIRVERHEPRYVTFVNPQLAKGVCVVARIIQELSRRWPEIPILIVESRARAEAFRELGMDLAKYPNVRVMANTPRPTDFYEVSKIVLMPSVCEESFGLVAAEAMYNGIPVLASNRGALPEVVAGDVVARPRRRGVEGGGKVVEGQVGPACRAGPEPQHVPSQPDPARQAGRTSPSAASGRPAVGGVARSGDRPQQVVGDGAQQGGGFLFEIPARYTPETTELPTAEEVAPWIETILRLWDDAEFYAEASRRAREQAGRWSPERLAPIYRDFFNNVRCQPGPPIMWRPAAQK